MADIDRHNATPPAPAGKSVPYSDAEKLAYAQGYTAGGRDALHSASNNASNALRFDVSLALRAEALTWTYSD